MKNLFLVVAFMFSMLTFAQNKPEVEVLNAPPQLCLLIAYNVGYQKPSDCFYQEPGEYILVACRPFYTGGNINDNWSSYISDYWCEYGKFPEGVTVRSFYPSGPLDLEYKP
ncbi:hypothetical protein [Myroides sp. TSA_177.3]|uniref:hypothetical protein n=1 Tax=Myroides sp. TSA_177.3 TaxID=3415650 RepID=UPI004045E0A4